MKLNFVKIGGINGDSIRVIKDNVIRQYNGVSVIKTLIIYISLSFSQDTVCTISQLLTYDRYSRSQKFLYGFQFHRSGFICIRFLSTCLNYLKKKKKKWSTICTTNMIVYFLPL